KGGLAIPTGRPLTGPLRRKFRQLSALGQGWSGDRTTSGCGHIGRADPPGIADAKIRLEAAGPVRIGPVELPVHAIELSRFGQIKLTAATGIEVSAMLAIIIAAVLGAAAGALTTASLKWGRSADRIECLYSLT